SKNTSHTFKVKAIGKNGKSAESTVLTVSTNNIQTPTYSVTPSVDTWATSKTVTITYPGTKTDNLIYEYSKDGGTTWTSVTASSASVTFTSNGSVIARVRDTGNTENTTTASTLTVSKVDTTAPTVTVSGNTSDWSINKTLTIQASDTDSGLASSPYSFDGGNTWQASASKTFTTNQTVTIWVKDQVGNIEKQSVIINKIDTVAPSNVTLTQGSITSSSITVTASATQANMGIRGYQFSIDGGSYGAEQTSVSKTFTGLLKNTSHTFKVKAIAMNGKETESSTITLTTSNIVAPSYSLVEGSMDDWSSTKEILITFERNALSHHIYEYSNDGGTTWVRSLEATTTVTFTSNGTLIARIRDTGNVENTTTASTLTVSKIDTTPPTFTVSENTSDWSINKTLTIEATDTESGVSKSPYSFNRGSTWSTAKSHTFSTNQTVDVWVRDNVGNIAKQTFVISKIDTLAPSNVSLTKGSVTANSISVTANATQNQMGIRGYQFSINDGTWSTEQTSISKVFTDLDANTTYSIKVRVWGKNGKFTDSSPLSVTTATIELTPPTYSVSPAGDVVADTKQVTIQFPSPRPAGAEYHYSLDGGKTWPPASETAVVTFQKSGTLIARITYGNKTIFGTTLTVTNITGRATSTADKITGLSFNLYNASTAGYGLRVCFPYGSVTSNANVYYTIGSGRQVEISHDIGACYTTGMLDFEYNKLYSLEFSTYMYENKYSKVYFCYATNDGYGPNVECVEDPTIPTNMPTSPATTETPETTTPNYS
ncbi:MAG: hypothetical protein KH135_02740, partial [Firmicutes bacterium]|nr:hypothetical protein [Bacillota bacterium]